MLQVKFDAPHQPSLSNLGQAHKSCGGCGGPTPKLSRERGAGFWGDTSDSDLLESI